MLSLAFESFGLLQLFSAQSHRDFKKDKYCVLRADTYLHCGFVIRDYLFVRPQTQRESNVVRFTAAVCGRSAA